ncbi:hypothetical protein VaNZ11_006639 [Volvox africanus]|uniref:N-alpha-acetyltransferase 60 n=1 Tax=Volvox africanus TaxID=51714 RepID=A0ABQ5S1Y9_9CHLO|nr:hypothetical protein VaNZ11_006639 [Volvox africanus]
MAYLRLLRASDLRTIQNSYVELFQLQAPSRRALEDALASKRWLSLAAVSPDTSSPSRQEYMAGFVMSVVATVTDFHTDMNYYSNGGGLSAADGGEGGAGVGVQASGLETIGLPLEERAVNICVLGVLPSYRRRGLARLMLRQVVDSARTASACAVFLHVRPSNAAAMALYQSAGFVAAALLPDYYDNGDAPAGSGGSSGRSSNLDMSGNDAERVAIHGAPAEGLRTAGGDAVLLVMPLTELAAAAVAKAAAASREAVKAAVAAVAAVAADRNDAAVTGSTTATSSPGGVAVLDAAPLGDVAEATRPAPALVLESPQSDSRFAGRGLPNEPATAPFSTSRIDVTSGSTTTTTTTAGEPPMSGGNGSIGRSGSLMGILAAAAAGVADGLSGLLPGRARAGRSGSGGGGVEAMSGRQVQLGGEVLLEERGEDGEVYLRRKGDVEGAASADGGQGSVAALAVAEEEGQAGIGASASATAEESISGGLPQRQITCRALGGRDESGRARGMRLLVSGAGTVPEGAASPFMFSGRVRASAAGSRVIVPGRWSYGYGMSFREQRQLRQAQRSNTVLAVGALRVVRVVRVVRLTTTQLHL